MPIHRTELCALLQGRHSNMADAPSKASVHETHNCNSNGNSATGGAHETEGLPLQAHDSLSLYLRTQAGNTLRVLTSLLESAGIPEQRAVYAVYPVICVVLLLMPLVLCALALTTAVLFFSISFIVSTVLSGLAVATTFTTVVALFSLVVVGSVAIAALSATAAVFLVITLISLAVLPIVSALRSLNRSKFLSRVRHVASAA